MHSYFNRTFENLEATVTEIVEFEKKNTLFKDESSNILMSSSPLDLFKIINEISDLTHQICPLKETSIKILAFARKIISFYQNKLESLMDEEELEPKILTGICNNTIVFSNLIKEFMEKMLKIGFLKEEELEKQFESSSLLKCFVSISNNAKDHIFMKLFGNINLLFNKIFFLEINLENIIKEILLKKDAIMLLHDSFARKIWKNLLEKLVILYFQSFMVSCNKAATNDVRINFF